MQMSLVMSMRYIFGNDWNDACKFANDVIFPRMEALDFRVIKHDMLALIKKEIIIPK